MELDPRVIGTVLNVIGLLGVLALTAWIGLRILRSQNRWPKLLLPVLTLAFAFAALALITFPLGLGGSADSQQQVEVDR